MYLFHFILAILATINCVQSHVTHKREIQHEVGEIKGLDRKVLKDIQLKVLEECRVEFNVDKSKIEDYVKLESHMPEEENFKKAIACYGERMGFVVKSKINGEKIRQAVEIFRHDNKEQLDKSLNVIKDCEGKSYEELNHIEVTHKFAKCVREGYVQAGVKL